MLWVFGFDVLLLDLFQVLDTCCWVLHLVMFVSWGVGLTLLFGLGFINVCKLLLVYFVA